MKGIRKAGWLAGVLIVTMGLFCGSALADVTVYAEGAYTDADLVVYLYADINPDPDPILSYGVKLSYNTSELSNPIATKNTEVWYMGSSAPGVAYMDPDTSVPGEVVFIGGRLDTDEPTAGVSGPRVLLGSVKFTRANLSTDFGISLDRGRVAPFVNFASTAGADLDAGVSYNATIRERGDANADAVINVNDLAALRRMIGQADLPCWVDCNGDGVVNVNDLVCLRRKL